MISLQTTMPNRDELLLRSLPAKKRLVLGGMSLPTAAAVLRFLYTGEAQLVPENVLDVHLASERLGISALRQLAEHMLPRIMCEENVCSILRDAFSLRLSGLTSFASAYALRHFDALLDLAAPPASATTSFPALHSMLTSASSSGFYSLPRPIVAGLLSSDDLCVASEEKVFRFAVFWGISNVPTNAKVYSGEDYNPTNTTKNSTSTVTGSTTTSISTTQSFQVPVRSSVAAAASGLATFTPSQQINNSTPPLSSQNIASQLFPQIPIALVPALRASLSDIFPSIRFQLLETDVLRSPLCTALVPPELLLNAMFEKSVGPNRRDTADVPSSSSSTTPSLPSSASILNGMRLESSSSSSSSLFSRNAAPLYQVSGNKTSDNPRILSLGSLLLDDDTGAGASAILSARTALSATSGYLSFSSPRQGGITTTTATYPSSSSTYYSDRDVYKSVDLEMASALAAEVGGSFESSSSSTRNDTSTPWESQNMKNLLQSSNNKGAIIPYRRFSQLDWTTIKDVTLLRFDAFMQGKVILGNLGRSAAFTAQTSPAVISSLPTSATQIALAASSSSAEGVRGATLLSMIPCVSMKTSATTTAVTSTSSQSDVNIDPVLPAGPIYSFEFVLEDSEALHDVDPEDERTKTKAAVIGSTTIAPFELALCLFPNGNALASLVSGQKSPDPAANGAVWCLTNRGDLYSSITKTVPTSLVTPSLPSSPPLPSLPEGVSSISLDEKKESTSSPPILTCVATDIRFGVSSSICLSVDTSSGDIGVTTLNVRVGFDSDGNFDGAGWDDGDDDDDDDYTDETSRGAGALARGVLERSTACAPRSPPLPFQLLQRASSMNEPSILHSSDPSMGKLAFIHAAACKLPVDELKLSSGLQLCLLARSTNRLAITLVPAKGFCRQ